MGLIFCRECGHQISESAPACPKCGAASRGAGGRKQVNHVVAILMSIFFGWLGVDRFMMGHIGLGILKLCTFGGMGIWWMIDIILVATKSNGEIDWV